MGVRTYRILFLATEEYRDLANIFAVVGFHTQIVPKSSDLLEVLRDITEAKQSEFAIIVMPEKFVELTKPIRMKLREKGKYIPSFLFLPDIREPRFLQLEELNDMLRRVQGVTIEQLQSQREEEG